MVEIANLTIAFKTINAEQALSAVNQIKAAGLEAERVNVRMTQSADQVNASFSTMALRMLGIGSAYAVFSKVAHGLSDMAKESITTAMAWERMRLSWGGMMGDMEGGARYFDEIRVATMKWPMSFNAVQEATVMLKGFGIAQKEILPWVSRLADAARGQAPELSRLALVYGQVAAQGKAMARDLYQFINAGVPIIGALAQVSGESSGNIIENMKTGRFVASFDMIQEALKRLTDAGGLFYGQMDKFAESAQGKWTLALKNFNVQLEMLGERLLPTLTKVLEGANKVLAPNAVGKATFGYKAYTDIADLIRGGHTSLIDPTINRIEQEDLAKFGPNNTAVTEEYVRTMILPNLWSILGRPANTTIAELEYKQLTRSLTKNEEDKLAFARSQKSAYDKFLSSVWKFGKTSSVVPNDLENPFTFSSSDVGSREDPQDAIDKYRYESETRELATIQQRLYDEWNARESAKESYGSFSAGEHLMAPDKYEPYVSSFSSASSKLEMGESWLHQLELERQAQAEINAETERYKSALQGINDEFGEMLLAMPLSGLERFGELLGEGRLNADGYKETLEDVMSTILKTLPKMFLQAGLSQIGLGNYALGLGLLTMAGGTAFLSGVDQGTKSTSSATSRGLIGSPSVFVYNNAQGTNATATEATMPDGSKAIVVTVEQVMASAVARGTLDSIMARKYGLKALGVRR